MDSLSLSLFLICGLSLLSTIGGQKVDNCSLLKPDDRYEGIELYIKYSYDPSLPSRYRSHEKMYNKRGIEWEFQLTKNHKIEFKPQTEIKQTYIAKKFGVFYTIRDKNYASIINSYNCEVNEKDFNTFKCFNTFDDRTVYTVTKSRSIGGEIGQKSIIFRPFADKTKVKTLSTLILNKENKQKIWFNFDDISGFPRFVSNCDDCPKIQWIDQLEDSMLQHLDGILGFDLGNDGKDNVFVLWFNIDGEPKYCITQESKDLSENCQSIDELIPAFPECFALSTNTRTVSADYIWLSILGVEVVLAFILIYAIYRKLKDRNRLLIESLSKSGPTTYDPSLSETNNSLG